MAEKIENKNPGELNLFAINSIYLYSGDNEKTIALLNNRQANKDEFKFCYLDFMLGLAKMNKLDFTSEKYFNDYVANFKGRSFVKSAYQKLAWIDLLKGDTIGYHQNMKLTKEKGNDFTDEDKQALKEAELNEVPNIYLLRSRLLFDSI